jgi:hypothetical protein
VRFNPTLFYFRPLTCSILFGIGWEKTHDNVGTPIWRIMLWFGLFSVRIERGL